MKEPKISILILSFNAPKYVYKTISSLQKTKYKNYEVIVFDNNSRWPTKCVNFYFYLQKKITKLIFSPKNILFSPGNNAAFKFADSDAEYILLLNSDIEIKDPNWLNKLLEMHEFGATSFGSVLHEPLRADGYCLLIDKVLYEKYQLDEQFEWWWSVTKFQAEIMHKENAKVKAFSNHEKYLHHFGGASRKGYNSAGISKAKGQNTDIEIVKKWFAENKIEIIDEVK